MNVARKPEIFIALGLGAVLVMKFWPIKTATDPVMTTGSRVQSIAIAIAKAEGFLDWSGNKKPAGTIPVDRHNPGDLTNLLGIVKTYATDEEGWNGLYAYIQRMIDGTGHYNTSMSWAEIGKIYDGEAAYMNWTNNVTQALGVPLDSTLGDFVNA